MADEHATDDGIVLTEAEIAERISDIDPDDMAPARELSGGLDGDGQMAIGGVALDALHTHLYDIDPGLDPARIIIEPETPKPSDDRYQVSVDQLEYVEQTDPPEHAIFTHEMREASAEAEFSLLCSMFEDEDGTVIETVDDDSCACTIRVDVVDTDDGSYQLPEDVRTQCAFVGADITGVRFDPESETYEIDIEV